MRQSFLSRVSGMLILLSICSLPAFSQDLTDQAIKKNISPIEEPLKFINSLQPRVFEYNTSQYSHLSLPAGRRYGFIAEEFRQVFPALVYKKPYSFMAGKNSYKTATVQNIDMESLIPVLIASIQEQQVQIEQLRTELETLKKR